jgi:spore germination protein
MTMSKFLPLIFLFFLLSGCIEEQIVDHLKLIQSIGFDIQGDTIKGSAAYLTYTKEQKNAPIFLLTAQSQTEQGIYTSFTAQSEYLVEIGQTRTMVISEKYAKRGISEFAAVLARDPIISSNTIVIITTQTASEILSESIKHPAFYMDDLIKQNMNNGNTPLSNNHLLLNQYYEEGQDVYLPVLNKNQKGLLQMDGVGVFKGDKLQLLLTNKEGLYLKLLNDKKKLGTYEFTSEQNDKIFLRIIHGKSKISLEPNEKVAVSLKLTIKIPYYSEKINLKDKNDVTSLKKQIENKFTTEIKKMLEKLQNNDIDPVGLGDLYRSKQRKWSEKEFSNETYPNVKFEVNTKIILQSGAGP